MNFEQACRFATSDSGYRIFAQSEGFSEENASSMTSTFNDVMNSIFGKVGQSMITLKISNNDALIARLTLRSDIKSRKSMFTNAAVIPNDFFSRMMLEDPSWMLHFPYGELLSQRPGSERLDPIRMEYYEPDNDSIRKICNEYDLDKSALTDFIIRLYRAVIEGSSLCLSTNLDSSHTPELAVKYAVLAAALLPPSLRKMFTFSSMGDARCVLCVQPTDGGELLSMGKEIYRFQTDKGSRGVSNNESRTVGVQDGLTDMFVNFANLLSGKLTEGRAELEKTLRRLDETADAIAGTRRGSFSFELLLISYYQAEVREVSLIEAVYLINSLLRFSQENPTNDSNVNALLAKWTGLLSDAGVCANINITAPLAVRAIDQKDELLYDAVSRMLKYAADETRTGLAQIILRKEYSERQKQLVNELLIENPAPWSDELLETIFTWSCRYNITDLAPVIWKRKNEQISRQTDNVSESAQLLHRLLRFNAEQEQGSLHRSKAEKLFNECEMFYMANGLREVCDSVNCAMPQEVLSDEEVKLINAHYGSFSEESLQKISEESLRKNWISYLVMFRYCAGKPLDQQVRSLKEMKAAAPAVFEDVFAALKADQESNKILLEAYWTETLLGRCSSLDELAEVCKRYNITKDPEGVMEKQVRQKWLSMTAFYSDNSMRQEMESLMRHYDLLDKAKMSEQTGKALKNEITLRFWRCVNLDTVLKNAQNEKSIPYIRKCMKRLEHEPDKDISTKMVLYYYAVDAFLKPENLSNHAFFRSLVEDGEWSCEEAAKDFSEFRSKMHRGKLHYGHSDISVIQKYVMRMGVRHLNVLNTFYIDYFLFGTYYKDEKRPDDEGYDFDEFRAVLDRLIAENHLHDRTQIRLEDSQLLSGEEAVLKYRKDIRKLITRNDPISLRQFSDYQLKEQSKGFLGFFGRRKNDESESFEDEEEENMLKAGKKKRPRKGKS